MIGSYFECWILAFMKAEENCSLLRLSPPPLQRTTMAWSYLNGANFPAAISGGINKNFNSFPLYYYKLVLDFPLPSLELPVVDNYFQKLDGEPIGLLKSPLGIFTCTQNKIFYHKSSSSNIEKVSSSNLVQYLKKSKKNLKKWFFCIFTP